MKNGSSALQRFDAIITSFKTREIELQIPEHERTVTNALLEVHSNQRKHFIHCVKEPHEEHRVFDRFGRATLKRSSGGLEGFFKWINTMARGSVAPSFGTACILSFVCDWNLKRRILHDASWSFKLYSVLELSLAQHVLLSRPACVDGQLVDSIGMLPLGLEEDCDAAFGTSVAYETSDLTQQSIDGGEATSFSVIISNVLDEAPELDCIIESPLDALEESDCVEGKHRRQSKVRVSPFKDLRSS